MGKRLKKDCPCESCQKWRLNREMKRRNDRAVKQIAKALEVGMMYGGGPLQVEPLSFQVGRMSSSEPQPQSISRDSGKVIGRPGFVIIGDK